MQCVEIAANGHLADRELVGKVGDPHASGATDLTDDPLVALLRE
jgi:hypothetical protein